MVGADAAHGDIGFEIVFSFDRGTREGEVGTGDEIRVIARDANALPVLEITWLYVAKRFGNSKVRSVQRAVRVASLPECWKACFGNPLEKMGTLKH